MPGREETAISQSPMSQISTTTSPKRDDELLSPEFVRRLERLDILSRKILAGRMAGERRSKKKGRSVEFADYRQYVAGDDLRFIDWNLYARLERLFLRLFMEEEDLCVWLLVDVSRSMDFGEPNKLLYAKRLVAALGYLSLVHYNRVQVLSFADQLLDRTPPLRGRLKVPILLDFLRRLEPAGRGALEAVMRRFALAERGRGVVVVISDFLDKGNLEAALRHLAAERFDGYLLQLLSPQEIDPEKAGILGDLRLRDMEDGQIAEVSAGPALLKRYRANLQAFCNHLRQQALRRGLMYSVSDTSVPFEQLVLMHLRQRGLVG